MFPTTHDRGSTLRYHRHGVAYITLVVSGRYTEVHSLSAAPYSAGGVIVHGLHEEHSDYFTDDAICLNLEIDDAPLQEIGDDARCKDRDVQKAADALIAAYYQRGDVVGAARTLQLTLRNAAQKPATPWPDWLQYVLHAFEWTGGEPIRAAANLADLHPAYFSRAFTMCLGITPVGYRRRARIQAASRMVLSTEQSLAAIAAASGFSDQSHLTRAFTESLGMTPSHFRRTFGS